jgi:predicted nucleic acid-binding protein
MNKLKVYLETTMFNYYFDTDRDGHTATVAMFEAIGRNEFEGFTSMYTVEELKKAPEQKRNNMMGLIEKYRIKTLAVDDEANRLAEIYMQNNVIPKSKQLDALHIGIASINELDYILSFNFKHINKLKTKRMVESINLNLGYKSIVISQPMEVIDYEV